MSSFPSDALSLWRRACLLAEALCEIRKIMPEDELAYWQQAASASIRCAAEIAAADPIQSPSDSLRRLYLAARTLDSLLAMLSRIRARGPQASSECELSIEEALALRESIFDFIRSLRSSD